MKEYKTIPGFSRYAISEDGELISYTRETPRHLKPHIAHHGHLEVNIFNDDGKCVHIGIHRLVLLAHLGLPPTDKPNACHNDGNPSNNHISNLRWDNQKGNIKDALSQGKFNHRHTDEWREQRRLTSKQWANSEEGKAHFNRLSQLFKGKTKTSTISET